MCESPQTHVIPGSCKKSVLYGERQKYGMASYCEALFGADDMHDPYRSVSDKVGRKIELHTLTPVRKTEVSESKFLYIFLNSHTLCAGIEFCNKCIDGLEVFAGDRTCIKSEFNLVSTGQCEVSHSRNVMIESCKGAIWPANIPPSCPPTHAISKQVDMSRRRTYSPSNA